MELIYKKCKKCEETKNVSDFPKGRNKCKTCQVLIKADYYKENSDRLKSARKEYYKNNSEVSKERCQEWRKKNPDKIKGQCRAWQEDNRDRSRAIKTKYSKTLKGKITRSRKVRKRRAIEAEALHPEHNVSFESVFEKMRVRLTNCLRFKFHLDHIFPISQGGPHYHGNFQVIPSTLNIIKGNRLNYFHPILIHWTELPNSLINWKITQQNNKTINYEAAL